MSATSTTPAAQKPNRMRFALFVFLGVYPLVTACMYVIMPLTPDWAIWTRTLIMVPVIVIAMVFFIIPTIQTRFRRWL